MFGAMSASRELQRQLRRIEPCLPRPAKVPPMGAGWIHEIKHDGYRIMARRDAAGVRTPHSKRPRLRGAFRWPRRRCCLPAVRALSTVRRPSPTGTDLRCSTCTRAPPGRAAVLCAFDLLELDGEDLRREPIETRKNTLKSLLRGKHEGIAHTHTVRGAARIIETPG